MEKLYNDNNKTEKVRNMIHSLKEGKSGQEQLGIAVIDMFRALFHMASLSLLVWIGLYSISSFFALPVIGYLQTTGVLIGLRAFSMAIIEPLLKARK